MEEKTDLGFLTFKYVFNREIKLIGNDSIIPT